MTVREAYEYSLIEINKIEAPSMLLEDYMYLFNKAIQQKVNEIYNRADVNQQATDDLSTLQVAMELKDIKEEGGSITRYTSFELPLDYFHLLNCIVTFEIDAEGRGCYSSLPTTMIKGCKKLTSDIYPQIINNKYMAPSYRNPYFYISTNERALDGKTVRGEDIEVHYGLKDLANVKNVFITYLKKPNTITLTQAQIDDFEDTSEVLQFPDYMCYEIINTFIKLILDNSSDPRLQTTIPINQTIAVPGVQQ